MREVVIRCTCDRCKTLFEQQEFEGQKIPEAAVKPFSLEGSVVAGVAGNLGLAEPRVEFDDLCPKCVKRLETLVEQIVKASKGRKPKPKPAPAATKTSKPKAA